MCQGNGIPIISLRNFAFEMEFSHQRFSERWFPYCHLLPMTGSNTASDTTAVHHNYLAETARQKKARTAFLLEHCSRRQ